MKIKYVQPKFVAAGNLTMSITVIIQPPAASHTNFFLLMNDICLLELIFRSAYIFFFL